MTITLVRFSYGKYVLENAPNNFEPPSGSNLLLSAQIRGKVFTVSQKPDSAIQCPMRLAKKGKELGRVHVVVDDVSVGIVGDVLYGHTCGPSITVKRELLLNGRAE